jgi:formylglycine-generating enzyme required for sulfatase activity
MKRKLILIALCVIVLFTVNLSIRKQGQAETGWVSGGQSTEPGGRPANVAPPETVRENSKDGLKYVWIPPGTFMMGCSPGDNECLDPEIPAHRVTITKGFWIGQTPVTVGAYKRFAGATGRQMPGPPDFNNDWANENMPIVNVSWDDAQAYCGWVAGRLPTEAEWEYAARGGSTEPWYGPVDEVAWYFKNSGFQPHDVAQKRPNGFGLYDMLGNVWQWVNDWYGKHYYHNSPSQDPPGPAEEEGDVRVLRGGSWRYYTWTARVSCRFMHRQRAWYDDIGFRCAGEVGKP